MKKIIAKILASLIGFMFFSIGVLFIQQSWMSARHGIETSGKIVGITTSRGSKGSILYAPEVEFSTLTRQNYRFVSQVSRSFRPSIGNSVSVIYDPEYPQNAVIKSLFNMYIFPAIFSIVGLLILFMTLFLPSFISKYQQRKIQRLRSMGRHIQAQITGVTKTELESNQSPFYALSAQWLDPTTHTMHVYQSFLSYDPSQAIEGRKEITVYVNPSNPKDYWMDTSFLPTLEE